MESTKNSKEKSSEQSDREEYSPIMRLTMMSHHFRMKPCRYTSRYPMFANLRMDNLQGKWNIRNTNKCWKLRTINFQSTLHDDQPLICLQWHAVLVPKNHNNRIIYYKIYYRFIITTNNTHHRIRGVGLPMARHGTIAILPIGNVWLAGPIWMIGGGMSSTEVTYNKKYLLVIKIKINIEWSWMEINCSIRILFYRQKCTNRCRTSHTQRWTHIKTGILFLHTTNL